MLYPMSEILFILAFVENVSHIMCILLYFVQHVLFILKMQIMYCMLYKMVLHVLTRTRRQKHDDVWYMKSYIHVDVPVWFDVIHATECVLCHVCHTISSIWWIEFQTHIYIYIYMYTNVVATSPRYTCELCVFRQCCALTTFKYQYQYY